MSEQEALEAYWTAVYDAAMAQAAVAKALAAYEAAIKEAKNDRARGTGSEADPGSCAASLPSPASNYDLRVATDRGGVVQDA